MSPASGALLFTDFNIHEKSVLYEADNHTSEEHSSHLFMREEMTMLKES
jgi:hypothetical protein